LSSAVLAQPKLFGLIAMSQGFITKEHLDECITLQQESTVQRQLGTIMLERGHMTAKQVMQILAIQARAAAKPSQPQTKSERKRRLGEILVERGYIDRQTLTAVLRRQELLRKNGVRSPVGEILVALGKITRNQLSHALEMQKSA